MKSLNWTRSLGLLLALAMSAVIAGCSGCSTSLPKPATGKQSVAYAYAAYGIAATGLSAYTNAPTCTNPVTAIPCSKPDIVARIRAADAKAYEAVKAADRAVFDPNWNGDKPSMLLVAAKQALLLLTSIGAEAAFSATAPPRATQSLQAAEAEAGKIQ